MPSPPSASPRSPPVEPRLMFGELDEELLQGGLGDGVLGETSGGALDISLDSLAAVLWTGRTVSGHQNNSVPLV